MSTQDIKDATLPKFNARQWEGIRRFLLRNVAIPREYQPTEVAASGDSSVAAAVDISSFIHVSKANETKDWLERGPISRYDPEKFADSSVLLGLRRFWLQNNLRIPGSYQQFNDAVDMQLTGEEVGQISTWLKHDWDDGGRIAPPAPGRESGGDAAVGAAFGDHTAEHAGSTQRGSGEGGSV